jgi:hypothetical protein
MKDILDKHKQDFNEIRRLCLICHGLDISSNWLFSDSTYKKPSENTKYTIHSLLSSSLLNLAISIRVNLYQGLIGNQKFSLDTLVASYYEENDLLLKEVTIKDICDKIIHADSVSKSALIKEFMPKDVKNTIQLKGKLGKKNWTLDLCLELFAEKMLMILDEIEEKKC